MEVGHAIAAVPAHVADKTKNVPQRDELLPLEFIDIELVETDIVRDEHRVKKLLRRFGWAWESYVGPLPSCFVDPETGEPVDRVPPLLRVYDPGLPLEERSVWARKKCILTVPEDPNSDYLTAEALRDRLDAGDDLAEAARLEMPFWVPKATYALLNRATAEGKMDIVRTYDNNGSGACANMPVRCRFIKANGERCWNWSKNAAHGRPYCKVHDSAKIDESVINGYVVTARERVILAAPAAADALVDLATSAVSEPVQLKAATEILDRAGVRGGVELEVTADVTVTENPAEIVRARLVRLAEAITARGELEPAPADDGSEP